MKCCETYGLKGYHKCCMFAARFVLFCILCFKKEKYGDISRCSWKNGDSTIASVNSKGIVTAKKHGSVVIKAKLYGR